MSKKFMFSMYNYTNRLIRFLLLALSLTPARLWWALAGLLFFFLNLLFHKELWPNTPQIFDYFPQLALGCFVIVIWSAVRTVWLVSNAVTSRFWRSILYVFWVLSMMTAVLVMMAIAFVFYFIGS